MGAAMRIQDRENGDRDHQHAHAKKDQKLFAHRRIYLVAQQFAERLQAADIIADRFDSGGDRDGQQQTNAAP